MNIKNTKRYLLPVILSVAVCLGLLAGCHENTPTSAKGGHEPLTILAPNLNYSAFENTISERFPEIRLEFISYIGGNPTGYSEYLLRNDAVPDIYTLGVFGLPDKQAESLLDLSGYEFLNNYKTADINQVTLDGAVYLLPTNLTILGIYYNKTMFDEHGWEVPENFDELKSLADTIRLAGIDPLSAQFELAGNGFFDLFTLAKTDFLSTTAGRQWERDFQAGKASAESLLPAAEALQEWIDCGLLEKDDTERSYKESNERFLSGETAMYLNAGLLSSFTQNSDGTGDQYGLMPYFGLDADDSVLITMPAFYVGLSKKLGDQGQEQKLADALKIMEFLSTKEGQQSLVENQKGYITPLKNDVIPEDSPFYEVGDEIRSGHTSNLAYAGYEPIIIDVGNMIRDWVAGKYTGAEVLAFMDELQTIYIEDGIEPLAVVEQGFTQEETARLVAEVFRQAAGTDVGLVSLGGYHDGVQNESGVCARLFPGDITQELVNAIVPSYYRDEIYVLTLTGDELLGLLQTGFFFDEHAAAFPYVPAGITAVKDKKGVITGLLMEDGTPVTGDHHYTVAVDAGGFTQETGEAGNAKKTEYIVVDEMEKYMKSHPALVPLS